MPIAALCHEIQKTKRISAVDMHNIEILALALLARLVPMFWSLPGVLVAVTGPKRPSSAEIEAELTQDIDA